MFGLQLGFLFLGVSQGIPPAIASLLLQTQVFFTIFLAHFFLHEKLDRWQLIGSLLSGMGIGYVCLHVGEHFNMFSLTSILLSALSWSGGNVIAKKVGDIKVLSLIVWGCAVTAPFLLLFSLLFEGVETIGKSLHHFSWAALFSILYIAYLATLFAFWAWNLLIRSYHLTTIALFGPLIPIVAMVSSALILGEPLQPWKIVSGFFVILGLFVYLLGPRLFGSAGKITL